MKSMARKFDTLFPGSILYKILPAKKTRAVPVYVMEKDETTRHLKIRWELHPEGQWISETALRYLRLQRPTIINLGNGDWKTVKKWEK